MSPKDEEESEESTLLDRELVLDFFREPDFSQPVFRSSLAGFTSSCTCAMEWSDWLNREGLVVDPRFPLQVRGMGEVAEEPGKDEGRAEPASSSFF